MRYLRYLPAIIGAALAPAPADARSSLAELSLTEQSQTIPPDFRDHFFNVPLATRVVADGSYLGEAMVVMTRDEKVQLLHFSDTADSTVGHDERERIKRALEAPLSLKRCGVTRCNGDFRIVAFDAASSTLDLATFDDARGGTRRATLAPSRATGAIINQRSNIVAGGDGGGASRYWVDILGSAGGWTTTLTAQHGRSSQSRKKGETQLQNLHAQRELKGHFVRAGHFQPEAQGLYRQPRTIGARAYPVVGVMMGTSDSLRADSGASSTQPVYVTARRAAIVEIYRDGALINAQPIAAGLQPIDTRPLPTGIYPVELRVIEDGVLRSNTIELIYKPGSWSDPTRRWRYNVFTGQRTGLGDYVDNRRDRRGLVAGAAINALIHPRAVLGVSSTVESGRTTSTASLDINAGDWASIYANVYHAGPRGKGGDLQWIARFPRGSLSVGRGDTWVAPRRPADKPVRQRNWYASGNLRLGRGSQLVGRVSLPSATKAAAFDLSYDRNFRIAGSDVYLRTSAFDRPGPRRDRGGRDRGVEVSATFALSSSRDAWSANLGQRAGARSGREGYGTISYLRQREGVVPQLTASLSGERSGVGMATAANVALPQGRLDLFANRSSVQGKVTGGLNVENTTALGGGHAARSGMSDLRFAESIMMIDVVSDAADVKVHAADSQGGSTQLKPGRNVVPLPPYRPGRLNIDVSSTGDATASVDRRTIDYHVNRGSVLYSQVQVTRTRTILGRLVNAQLLPLAGATVEQGSTRAVSDSNGVFVIEVAAKAANLGVLSDGKRLCDARVRAADGAKHEDVESVGDVRCESDMPELAPH
ncbi:TcfC E-set like domain-containing protein [Pinirhizobacter soli]|uniref:TcfC E-set like domain-containing protein n=1 Tax=Pinirhizobacter soli TaxID=2786953 RepID=UPI00202A6F6D|nr:TcfC E-set like domain-containing protein [Pinirhizobacter soli]